MREPCYNCKKLGACETRDMVECSKYKIWEEKIRKAQKECKWCNVKTLNKSSVCDRCAFLLGQIKMHKKLVKRMIEEYEDGE